MNKYELQPTQISTWKQQVMGNFSKVFSEKSDKLVKDEVDIQSLYAQIGELKVANDFLKKVAMKPVVERRTLAEPDHKLSVSKQCSFFPYTEVASIINL